MRSKKRSPEDPLAVHMSNLQTITHSLIFRIAFERGSLVFLVRVGCCAIIACNGPIVRLCLGSGQLPEDPVPPWEPLQCHVPMVPACLPPWMQSKYRFG